MKESVSLKTLLGHSVGDYKLFFELVFCLLVAKISLINYIAQTGGQLNGDLNISFSLLSSLACSPSRD